METRLADLLAGLSRLADLGFGLQAGEALRSCALATHLARSLDLPEEDAGRPSTPPCCTTSAAPATPTRRPGCSATSSS
ncbi:MAG TPA: hypothetical protein VG035_01220 [Actinomycetota bacterium]|nr:hypothetical protein [Actinomycetota bacterium]